MRRAAATVTRDACALFAAFTLATLSLQARPPCHHPPGAAYAVQVKGPAAGLVRFLLLRTLMATGLVPVA